jgi:CheY-like chemotaxis protein
MAENPLRKVRVLIVDDQPLMRKLVSQMLHGWGFTDVTITSSGREALEHILRQPVDLIISDWRMGEMNGIELLGAIRDSRDPVVSRIPFIFLTGNAELSDVQTARDTGMNEYLIKPFTAAELMRRVRSVIESPRSFVKAPAYRGPDRRRRAVAPPQGEERRKGVDHGGPGQS